MSPIEKVSTFLGISIQKLISESRNTPRRYKVFHIEKRKKGEFREIAQPTKKLKEIQRWIVSNIINTLPIHKAATAYKNNSSLIENVNPHIGNTHILKLDFLDFFNNIKGEDFAYLLKKNGFSYIDTLILSRYLLWRKDRSSETLCLSVGAPSSPYLSNAIMYEFDSSVNDFCSSKNICYTRYADDVTLSASDKNLLLEAENFLKNYISKNKHPNLKLNHDKRVLISENGCKKITGLVIRDNIDITTSKAFRKKIRAGLYNLENSNEITPSDVRKLLGQIAFLKSIDKKSYEKLISKHNPTLMLKAQNILSSENK